MFSSKLIISHKKPPVATQRGLMLEWLSRNQGTENVVWKWNLNAQQIYYILSIIQAARAINIRIKIIAPNGGKKLTSKGEMYLEIMNKTTTATTSLMIRFCINVPKLINNSTYFPAIGGTGSVTTVDVVLAETTAPVVVPPVSPLLAK